jgi:polyisoprenoid-binding protein YceI
VYFAAGRVSDSSVTLSIEARSLTVLDPDASEKDRRDVQATMAGAQVLDVARYEKITFRSTRVSRIKQVGNDWEVILDGLLNLHGVEKPITLPVRIHIESNRLRAEGEAHVLQTNFGMTPVRVGGGAVKVKDEVKIGFSIVADQTS